MSSNGSPGIVPEGLANLETVDYEKLLSSDAAEQLKVLSACENRGIFYLHLPRNENQDLWSRAAKVFAVAKELFDQPLQEKMKFHQSLSGPLETSGYAGLIHMLIHSAHNSLVISL
jgi:isopenicillin N synthase-like dioxygenase